MKLKNILLTSLVASLSFVGLVSCSDSDDSVKVTDASGNSVTIKKTDDKEEVATALNAIGSTNTTTISKFGVKLSNDFDLSIEDGTDTAKVSTKGTTAVEVDFNGVTYKEIDDEEELSDADRNEALNAIYNTKLYAELQQSGSIAFNTDSMTYNAALKAYKTAGTDGNVFLDFGECSVVTTAAKTSEIYEIYDEIKGISAFSGDKYKIPTSMIIAAADNDDLVEANNILYELQTNVGMLNVNTISKFASNSGVDLSALVEQFGVKISNVSKNTVEFKASMTSAAFASLFNLLSDDFKLEDTKSVYSLTLSADATTGFIKSMGLDFSNIKGTVKSDEGNVNIEAKTVKASLDFTYNDEVVEKTAPEGTYKSALEFYAKFDENFNKDDFDEIV